MSRPVLTLLMLVACVKPPAQVKETTAAAVAQGLAEGRLSVFDANTEAYRARYGAVPGAVLLSSFERYELSVLGADKKRPLVFYCANRL